MSDKIRKVYVVTRGEYSDYSIVAIFDNLEEAKKLVEEIKEQGSWSYPDIETYDLINKFPNLNSYTVQMDKEGNTAAVIHQKEKHAHLGSIFHMFSRPCAEKGQTVHRELAKIFKTEKLTGHVWAKNDVHAVKIVNERRTRILAENLWDEPKKAIECGLIDCWNG